MSDVDPLDQIAVEKAVESDTMADVITNNLQDVGFDNADVESADAEITTVEVIEMPEPAPPAPEQVIVAQQEFQGVNPDQAATEEFQEAVEQAVADQLDVDVEDVEVTSVNTNEKVRYDWLDAWCDMNWHELKWQGNMTWQYNTTHCL